MGLVDFVDGDISGGFLHADFVAVGYLSADPAGDVFGGGVDVDDVVEALVVESVDHLADVGEVYHHTVGVEGC